MCIDFDLLGNGIDFKNVVACIVRHKKLSATIEPQAIPNGISRQGDVNFRLGPIRKEPANCLLLLKIHHIKKPSRVGGRAFNTGRKGPLSSDRFGAKKRFISTCCKIETTQNDRYGKEPVHVCFRLWEFQVMAQVQSVPRYWLLRNLSGTD